MLGTTLRRYLITLLIGALALRYIDNVPRAERDEPLKRQKAEDIQVNNPQDFSPLAHRLRQ